MELNSDKKVLDKYSRDRSIYKITPKSVAFPKNEAEVIEIINFARKNKLPVTARGGGTGLSGSGIGKGVVIDFSKYFTKVYKVGKITKVQSGILNKDLRPMLKKAGVMLPSVPLHGDCAIGGNVNTRSIGPRTLKYGTMDKQVKSLRGILSDGRIVDTGRKIIPEDIKKKVLNLQRQFKKEKGLVKYMKSRPLAAGGYNLLSLIEYKKIEDIITHLIVGSVGTLLLVTEIELQLPRDKEFDDIYLVHFDNLEDFQKSVNNLIKNKVTSIEYAEKDTLDLWDREFQHERAKFTMIAAFENHKDIKKLVVNPIEIREIKDSELRDRLWKSRAGALVASEKSASEKGMDLPSGVDDTSIHPKYFADMIKAVKAYEKKSGISISSFGHIGVGSIHLRPMIDMKNNPEQLDEIGKVIFRILRKHNGTLVGEHNCGLCRSRYLSMESKTMYAYMKKVKDVFDPSNILNPRVIFNLEPITNNLGV